MGQGTLTSGWGLSGCGTGWWRLMHQERGAEVAAEGGALWQEGPERGHGDVTAHQALALLQAQELPHVRNQP